MVRRSRTVFSARHSSHVNRSTFMVPTAPSNTEEMKMPSRPKRFRSLVSGLGEPMAGSLTPVSIVWSRATDETAIPEGDDIRLMDFLAEL